MNLKALLLLSIIPISVFAKSQDSMKQEMQEMKRIHAECMDSQKASKNCHQDMLKACDASKEDCLRMMERMNMKDVIKAQDDSEL